MSMKKYVVTKDIYHKGKLMKKGEVVGSETNHKYFRPYSRDEFSQEKEPKITLLADEVDSNSKYDSNGVVLPSKESAKAALEIKKQRNLSLKNSEGSNRIIEEAKAQAKEIINEAKREIEKIIEETRVERKILLEEIRKENSPKKVKTQQKTNKVTVAEPEPEEDLKFPVEEAESDDAF